MSSFFFSFSLSLFNHQIVWCSNKLEHFDLGEFYISVVDLNYIGY